MDETVRAAYLATLYPGADVDHRGTPFARGLLERLLHVLRDPTTGFPRLGRARFDGAIFDGEAPFRGATFTSDAVFDGAAFNDDAWFAEAAFTGNARFDGAIFGSNALFGGATFSSNVVFDGATFSSYALFHRTTFGGNTLFRGVTFAGLALFRDVVFPGLALFRAATFNSDALFYQAVFSSETGFEEVTFTGDARFDGTRFEEAPTLGPLVCGGSLTMDGAVFGAPVILEIAAGAVGLARTRWASKAVLRLRYAELNLSDAVFEYPVTVTTHPTPFSLRQLPPLLSYPGPQHDSMPEGELSGRDHSVRLMSLSGVDAAHLALLDIDLSTCSFVGAVHLDQLRVDGWCTFASSPAGWGRRFPWRWSRRRVLAEEHHWRVRSGRRSAGPRGWTAPPEDAPEVRPAALSALYRQLRKSMEDGKNEPGAADFYYGECEMRRHDTTGTPRGERALLTAYWALSGYGLRTMRAMSWLVAAMTVTILVLMVWGLPADDPKPETTGRQVDAGQDLTLTTDTPPPVNPTGPRVERLTTERFEKSLRVVINSVVFRSSGQDLTTAGTYIEMSSRITEPVLLGLAVLALRNRVKR
ncbi:pentapeptide repeat-containing protein [Streptomyces sp. NBC_00872]|uniref:pentapeptide repeat-containing protein n=1 Tax=Streptomyces sp. NBC_00872 TaxID=2903686 RepID=UPI003866BE4B|nr:pentapeptide repeat-containing protein [Streptomyces sp. NBC_00872]